MHDELNPQAAEQQFFHSLIGTDLGALERILSDGFLHRTPDLKYVLRIHQQSCSRY